MVPDDRGRDPASGPMRFDRFMELAPVLAGRLLRRATGRRRPACDFVTSPHVHPIFAQLLAEAIRDLHEAMGGPTGSS